MRETYSSRRWVVPGLIGLAAVIAFVVAGYFARSSGLTPQEERRPMPPLTLRLRDGRLWRLSDHRGEVIAINYWASWCGPCWQETPVLVKLDHELRPAGLTIVGVAMDERNSDSVPPAVDRFVEQLHIPYAVALAAPMSQTAYGMDGLPTTVLVDRRGRVARTYVGAIREAVFRADVQSLIKENP
jgi:cytochrome c biogenesis protein CcmG/thiol:disulfide interchange protein DsbE